LSRARRELKSRAAWLYSSDVKAILALVVLGLATTGCHGPGGPMERAGRSVDDAVYDVGRGVRKAGQKIQQVAE
jgi:hypothetical protein